MEKKKNLQFYLFGSGILVLERAFRILTGLFIQGYLARYLGPSNYGYLNFTINFISILNTVVLFGFDEFVAKEFIHEEVHSLRTLNKVLGIRFVLSLFCYGLVIVSAKTYYGNDVDLGHYLMIYGIVLFCQPLLIYEVFLLTHGHVVEVFKGRLVSGIIANLFRVFGFILQAKVPYFLVATYADDIVNRFINHLSLKRKYKNFRWSKWFPVNKGLTREGFFAFLCAIFILLERRVTLLVMERAGNFHELGIFTSAYSIIEYSLLVPMILMGVFFPGVLHDHGEGKSGAKYKNSKSEYYQIIIFLGFLCGGGLFVLSDVVVKIIFGDTYATAANYLRLLCGTIPIYYFALARLKIALLEKQIRPWAYLGLMTLVLNIIFQYIMIKHDSVASGLFAFYGIFFASNLVFSFFSPFIRESVGEFFKSIYFPVTFFKKYF
ncbi:MAG: oligosaccharide flippase family protein [Bacteriovoracaceae bacterium]|nr:oligosaccharide flippase family protein [Bacteriovoracaceae bacterium]